MPYSMSTYLDVTLAWPEVLDFNVRLRPSMEQVAPHGRVRWPAPQSVAAVNGLSQCCGAVTWCTRGSCWPGR